MRFIFLNCLDYVRRTSIDVINEKARSRKISTVTIKGADHADDLVLLLNTPAQVESQLHTLKLLAMKLELRGVKIIFGYIYIYIYIYIYLFVSLYVFTKPLNDDQDKIQCQLSLAEYR